jgi:malate dehydrogenase
MSKTVTVTGAAGAIGYAILFRIASGQMLGPDEKIRLRLLEIEPALQAAEGTAMELVDCAFPLLEAIDITADPKEAFDGANVGLLIGARPRTKGMERADLLEANGAIFKPQGQAINERAADDVRILVVGNPANTNALIAQRNAPDVPRERFTAMTRLDENRAVAQLANKLGVGVADIQDLVVWGNHSPTMFPDLFTAKVKGRARGRRGRRHGLVRERVPAQRRQARRGDHRGARARRAPRRPPTPPSTTSATGSWRGRPALHGGAVRRLLRRRGGASSRPSRALLEGEYKIEQGLEVGDFAQAKIDITVDELVGERDAVQELGLLG